MKSIFSESYPNNEAVASDDDEEDIILPNSPLYNYFNVNSPSSNITNQQEFSTKARDRPSVTIRSLALNFSRSIKNMIVGVIKYFTVPVYNLFRCQHNGVQLKYYNHVLDMVIAKDIMIPEDVAFLKAFSMELPVTGGMCVTNILLWFSLPSLAIATLLAFCFSGNSDDYELVFKNNVIWVFSRKIIFFAASFVLTFFISYLALSVNHRLKFSSLSKKLDHLCSISKDMMDSFRQSFKIIQEAELVARGFSTATVIGSIQRIELAKGLPVASPERQLPSFRKILFLRSKNTFIQYRNYTKDLIECFPLTIDCVSCYFSTMNLKEFGKLLELDVNSSDERELLEVTDNLSLSALKSIFQLALVQVSEFMRRFCLSLYGELDQDTVNYCLTFQRLDFLIQSIEELTYHDTHILTMLKENIKFFRSGEELGILDISPFKSKENSQFGNFGSELHNFNLHVKAILRKGIAIEEFLCKPDKEASMATDKIHELTSQFKTSLDELKEELAACENCLQDCYNSIDLSQSEKDKKETGIIVPEISKEPDRFPKHILIEDADPVIEDEVFEAVIKESDSKDYSHDSCDDADSKNANNKLEQKTSANLMKELKTVLVVKAQEHRAREEKALKAKAIKDGSILNDDFEKKLIEAADDPISVQSEEDAQINQGIDEVESVSDLDFDKIVSPNELLDDADDPPETRGNSKLPFSFNSMGSGDFAASIAALAAQRQKKLNMETSTFECEADYISAEDEEDGEL